MIIFAVTMVAWVLMAQASSIKALSQYDNGLLTNLRKVKGQMDDYGEEIKYVIVPGIKNAKGLGRKVHKISAFGEEFVDKMPRLVWYTFLYGTVFNLIGALI